MTNPSRTWRDKAALPMTLIPNAKSRRKETAEALRTHAGLVIQAASRVLGSIPDAEDVAQDVAEKLLRSPPRAVKSWPALLKTMAVNRAIDLLRQRRDTTDEVDSATEDGPEQAALRRERAAALRRALRRLSGRDAALFALFYLADLPQADIARELGMTPTAVGVALHRARGRLASWLEPTLGDTNEGDL